MKRILALIFILATSAAGQTQFDRLTGNAIDVLQTGSVTPPAFGPTRYVGTASGLATAPNTAPVNSQAASGGSISAGTYYVCYTYFNKNGQTPCSPVATVVVAVGATNIIYVGNGDQLWRSGCYGYYVYASNNNVNFYRQTPSGVATDFQVSGPGGGTGHYVALGMKGARLTSLTFSGTTPPLTNTAVIDPLQVALNATNNAAFTAPSGKVITSGQLQLTTPLIVHPHIFLEGVSDKGNLGSGQSRLYSSWTDAKLATVMWFGGGATIQNLSIEGQGNALMLLGGVGFSQAQENLYNSSLYSFDATNTYSALKIVGIHYEIHMPQVYMRGGRAAVHAVNHSGGNWEFGGARWDLGGNSAFYSQPSWVDPDDGLYQTGPGGFVNAVANVSFSHLLTETGTGIIWDMLGISAYWDDVSGADSPGVATDSIAKFGADATYQVPGAVYTFYTLKDTYFDTSANARVGMNVPAGSSPIAVHLLGKAGFGFGGSTGAYVAADLGNIAGHILSTDGMSGSIFSLDPSATGATVPKLINVHNNTRFVVSGSGGGSGVADTEWSELPGRLALVPRNGTVRDRANRKSLMVTPSDNSLTVFGADDTTVLGKFGSSYFSTSAITVSNSGGTFTAGQEYVQSLLNSCNPQTEFGLTQAGGTVIDALTGCVAIPAGATKQANAVAGYATSLSNSAVGGYFQARPLANNVFADGANNSWQDVIGLTTGVSGNGTDVNVNPQNASSAYVNGGPNGVNVALGARLAGTYGNAFQAGIFGATPGQWNASYVSSNAATANAFVAGTSSAATPSASQNLLFNHRDAGGVVRQTGLYIDTLGRFTPNFYSADIHIQQNPGVDKALLAFSANTALRTYTFPDATGNIVVDTSTGVNIAHQLISTLATGTAPFNVASTTVVPNLNVSQLLGATWASPLAIGNTAPAAVTSTANTSALYATTTNCSSSASPAVCAAAPAGSVVIAAAATTVTVNTTAVTANSQIILTRDNSLGTKLSVTCNIQSSLVLGTAYVSARVAATSFTITIDVAPTTNPLCISYAVVN